MATYKAAWDNIQRVRPETNAYLQVGKQLWLLGLKGVVSGIHDYFDPVENQEEYISRKVYYETLYDHIDPHTSEASIGSTIGSIKKAKDHTSSDPVIVSKGVQSPSADDRPWWKKVLNIDAPSNTTKGVLTSDSI